MLVYSFIEPPLENNNYLLIDEESKEAALVDCSSTEIFSDIQKILKENCADLKFILLTHGHFDHIAGLKDNIFDVFMHKDDEAILKKANQYFMMFGLPQMQIPVINKFIENGDVIKLGKTEIKVIHTPGHTQGGVCYYTDNKLFSGDTIFRESVGRCDMEGGNFEQLVENIKTKIFTLPPEVVIYPGHGEHTSVGWEKVHNQFF